MPVRHPHGTSKRRLSPSRPHLIGTNHSFHAGGLTGNKPDKASQACDHGNRSILRKACLVLVQILYAVTLPLIESALLCRVAPNITPQAIGPCGCAIHLTYQPPQIREPSNVSNIDARQHQRRYMRYAGPASAIYAPPQMLQCPCCNSAYRRVLSMDQDRLWTIEQSSSSADPIVSMWHTLHMPRLLD